MTERQIYLILFLLFVALNLEWVSSFQMINDEAVTVHGAKRWLAGEWPYWDWTTRHAPGSYAITAAFMGLFGDSQWATRALMLLVASCQGLILFHLSRGLQGWLRFVPWTLWTILGLVDFPILGYHWISVLCFCLVVERCQAWVRRPRALSAASTGILASLCCFMLQSEGLAAITLVGLCWLRWRPKGLSAVLAGFAATSLLLWLPFLPVYQAVLQASVLEMRPHLLFNRHPYAWADLLPIWHGAKASSPRDLLGFCYVWLKLLIYSFKYGLLYIILALALFKERRGKETDRTILVVGAACMVAVNLNRQTLEYASYLLPLWFVVVAQIFGRRTLVLVFLSSAFWLCQLGIWWRDCRFPVSTPKGLYWSYEEWHSKAYGKLGEWALQVVGPGNQALCLPFQPCLYTLWDLKNPGPETNLIPISRPREAFEEMARRLAARGVQWIVFTPMNPWDCNADPAQFVIVEKEMLDLLTVDYDLKDQTGGMKLFHRR